MKRVQKIGGRNVMFFCKFDSFFSVWDRHKNKWIAKGVKDFTDCLFFIVHKPFQTS